MLNLQRLVDYVQEQHLDFNVALELVRASSLYTVHTPVPAGHDYFDEGLFGKYMGEYPAKLGISWNDLMNMGRENPNTNERFSMSVFALNTCQEANGVSWLHGEVSKKMFAGIWKGYNWQESHVGYVTNGVHMPTWAASEWKEFYAEKLGPKVFEHADNPENWKGIFKVKDEEIWNMRCCLKNKFINFVKRDFKAKWLANQGDPSAVMKIVDKINPNALIIGFARRLPPTNVPICCSLILSVFPRLSTTSSSPFSLSSPVKPTPPTELAKVLSSVSWKFHVCRNSWVRLSSLKITT